MPVGKRIYLQRELPDIDLMKEFEMIPASNVADTMNRGCAMNPRIRLMSSPQKQTVCGLALTVKCRAGDNLALHAALNICREGDILVVSNEGDTTRSLIGEIMISYLLYDRKVAAIVLDGPIRDSKEISALDFPVYATGTTPGGPYKEGPGEVNVPISCGEVSVHPGDVILCDPDGVIVIPRKDAPAVLDEARKYMETDHKKLIAAKTGTANRAWVEKNLSEKGFEIIDGVYG